MTETTSWLRTAGRMMMPATLTVALVTCATNPVTGRKEISLVGEGQEIQMGEEGRQAAIASMGLVPDSAVQQYVRGLGMPIAKSSERPNLPWSITVVDDPVVNAFALPGGPVFITRGILAHMNSEAQLVSVLGHEIGHITAKHSVQQMSQQQLGQIGLVAAMIVKPGLAGFGEAASQALGVLFLKYGRDAETQADELGFRYMTKDGYDPSEMAAMFRTLERLSAGGKSSEEIPEWLSTHPDPGNRVQKTMERIAATSLPAGLKVNRDQFLQHTEGLVFGDDPREGFFQQNRFMHPGLKFQLDLPSGWKAQNTKTALVGVSSQQDAMMALEFAGNMAPSQGLSEFFKQQGVTNQGTSSNAINGLTAATGQFTAQTEKGVLTGLVSYIQLDGNTYRILSYTPQQQFGNYKNAFQQSIGSFNRLTDPAALSVQPMRVHLVRIPRAMTIEEFNQAYPSKIPIAQLHLINGTPPGTSVPSGTLLKRVQ